MHGRRQDEITLWKRPALESLADIADDRSEYYPVPFRRQGDVISETSEEYQSLQRLLILLQTGADLIIDRERALAQHLEAAVGYRTGP